MVASIPQVFAAEGRKFLETTTIRGVQRIVKTKSRILFVFWLLAVLTAFGLLLWQLSAVFMRYTAYPVNTLYVQSPDFQNATFPDITICNLCPLVHESEMSLRYADYVNALIRTFNLRTIAAHYGINESDVSEDEWMYLVFELLSPAGYFRNFPITANQSVNSLTSPVLDCAYFNWDYKPNQNYNCFTQLKTLWDPDYYKCYTSSLSNAERKNVRGYSAVFYVEDFLGSEIQEYGLGLRNPRSTGIQVMIHPPGTIPDMKLGIGISPGTRTSIVLEQTVRTKQPAPYSNCTTQTTLGSNSNIYTQQYCNDVCIQDTYITACRCLLNTNQYTPEQLQQVNGTMCGNLSIVDASVPINWAGFDQYACAINFDAGNATQACAAKCFQPCQELRYTKSVSTAAWPHVSAQTSFYGTYISNNTRFGTVYDEYKIVGDLAISNASASSELLLKLNNQGLIQANFLQLNIMFNSHIYNEQKDVIAIPPEMLGSQIGGVLALWLGITIMVVLEIGEFIVTLAVALYQSRQARSKALSEPADSKL